MPNKVKSVRVKILQLTQTKCYNTPRPPSQLSLMLNEFISKLNSTWLNTTSSRGREKGDKRVKYLENGLLCKGFESILAENLDVCKRYNGFMAFLSYLLNNHLYTKS